MMKRRKGNIVIMALLAIGLIISALPAFAEETNPAQPELLEFSAEITVNNELQATFSGISADMEWVSPVYSFDGIDYMSSEEEGDWDWDLDWDFADEDELKLAQKHVFSVPIEEPMRSYLAGGQDGFYLKLRYRMKNSTQTLETKPYNIKRNVHLSLPEDVMQEWIFPQIFWQGNVPKRHALFQVTAREGGSAEALQRLLPTSLPVKVNLLIDGSDSSGNLQCGVEWKLPATVSAGTVELTDAIKELSPPIDGLLRTNDSIYTIDKPITPNMPFSLQINGVKQGEKAKVELYEIGGGAHAQQSLAANFILKPSGATRIVPFYSIDGGKTWSQKTDKIAESGDINARPKEAFYKIQNLFAYDETPYKEYKAGEIKGFLVRLEIEGGVFAGKSEIRPWPSEYKYEPPASSGSGDGSGGNENNAGSGGNNGMPPGSGDGSVTLPNPPPSKPIKPEVPGLPELPTLKPISPQTPDIPDLEDPGQSSTSDEGKTLEQIVDPTEVLARTAQGQEQEQGAANDAQLVEGIQTEPVKEESENDTDSGIPIGITATILLLGITACGGYAALRIRSKAK